MPWNVITTQDVLDELTPAEASLLQNIQGANAGAPNGQLSRLLAKVIGAVRGQIKAGGNQVDQSNPLSVPDQVADDVTCLARWKWMLSVPQLKAMQTPERREAAQRAEKRFAGIAAYGDKDRERTELPANVDTTPAAVPLPSVGSPKYDRRKRHGEDGIV